MRDGWMGVDLFFVLSGFLITGILRRERASEHYWGPFYLKRATRILPPMLLLITFVALHRHPPLRAVLPYYLLLGNFMVLSSKALTSLNILWSLAIEEHFYLVFPFAVRYLSQRSLVRLLVSVVAAEPVLRLIFCKAFPDARGTYNVTFFHLDGLALGALLALCSEHVTATEVLRKWAAPAFWLILALYLTLDCSLRTSFFREANSRTYNALGYTLVAAGSAAAIGYVYLHAESFVSRVLSTSPFVFLGSISYGFYLYHVHVRDFSAVTLHFFYPAVAIPTFLITTFLSWLSFRYFEKPIVTWGHWAAARMQVKGTARAAATPQI